MRDAASLRRCPRRASSSTRSASSNGVMLMTNVLGVRVLAWKSAIAVPSGMRRLAADRAAAATGYGRHMRAGKADVVTSPERRASYLRAGHWDSSTLAGRVGEHAQTRPGDLAVVDDRGRYTYGQLRDD